MTTTSTAAKSPDAFDIFASRVRERIARFKGQPIFAVRTGRPLFDEYLASFADPAERQIHNCHCCKKFIKRYGNLATADSHGNLVSLLWADYDTLPAPYAAACLVMARSVAAGRIDHVFYSAQETWGGETGSWTHFTSASPAVHRSVTKTAPQASAEKSEEYRMVRRTLTEVSYETSKKVVEICAVDDMLYRSEKIAGAAKWFLALHEKLRENHNKLVADAFIWEAVASAPAGFCHIRSGMLGTLFDDLASGMDFDDVKRRFADKMHPLSYLRPQAPPSDQNIAQAEKLFALLKTSGALDRRFARIEDLQCLWKPEIATAPEAPVGVFDHLRPKALGQQVTYTAGAPTRITWTRFARDVLPGASKIETRLPSSSRSFVAMVTAADAAADAAAASPPILQQDREDKRNPVSWYFHDSPTSPASWSLSSGQMCNVSAVTLSPELWDAEHPRPQAAKMVVFVLEGAKPASTQIGGGLFVESLKSEYHGVRRTLEAHFARAEITGRQEASACGLAVGGGTFDSNLVFRVTSGSIATDYTIDRWE